MDPEMEHIHIMIRVSAEMSMTIAGLDENHADYRKWKEIHEQQKAVLEQQIDHATADYYQAKAAAYMLTARAVKDSAKKLKAVKAALSCFVEWRMISRWSIEVKTLVKEAREITATAQEDLDLESEYVFVQELDVEKEYVLV